MLPFANMSGDAEQEYFSDGITEDLITDLSKVSGLFVIARNSSFAYKGKSVKVQEIGRELGVRFVLEGSIRKAGDRVRITAQLIDAGSGGHLWADRFDRDLTDIFATQDEVVEKIVGALAVKLTRGEERRLRRGGTRNVEAYEAWLRARELLARSTRELGRSIPGHVPAGDRDRSEFCRASCRLGVCCDKRLRQCLDARTGESARGSRTVGSTRDRAGYSGASRPCGAGQCVAMAAPP